MPLPRGHFACRFTRVAISTSIVGDWTDNRLRCAGTLPSSLSSRSRISASIAVRPVRIFPTPGSRPKEGRRERGLAVEQLQGPLRGKSSIDNAVGAASYERCGFVKDRYLHEGSRAGINGWRRYPDDVTRVPTGFSPSARSASDARTCLTPIAVRCAATRDVGASRAAAHHRLLDRSLSSSGPRQCFQCQNRTAIEAKKGPPAEQAGP